MTHETSSHKDNLKQKNFEGKDGKKELKKCFISRIDYIETDHGPQLFSVLNFDVARKNSMSFDLFLSSL
jgi:hypothetical protein